MTLTTNLNTLVKRRGQPASLIKSSSGAYDPSTGQYPNTETPYPIAAYFGESMLSEGSGRDIGLGTRWVVISGETTQEPLVGDKISGVDDTIVIEEVQKIYNKSVVVCYLCKSKE